MNYKEFWSRARSHDEGLDWSYYKNAHKIVDQYFESSKGIHIHHLRDTEEQRKYNDEHYELWGHNLDGTFEYGKYVIFVTQEEHSRIHAQCKETKEKIGIASKSQWANESIRNKRIAGLRKHWSQPGVKEQRIKSLKEAYKNPEVIERCVISHKEYYKTHKVSEETRAILREKNTGENNPMYGKHPSDETRKKMSESQKALWDDDRRKMFSEMLSGENAYWYGKKFSQEYKDKLSKSHMGIKQSEETIEKIKADHQLKSRIYKGYKLSGRSITWNLFQKVVIHNCSIMNEYSESNKEEIFNVIDILMRETNDLTCNN